MAAKTTVFELIEGLRAVGLYDRFTQQKLDILAATAEGPSAIAQKERAVIEEIFSRYVEKIEKEGHIRFSSFVGSDVGTARGTRTFDVIDFLGFGNMGPVYSVSEGGKKYALKIYSSLRQNEMMQAHGKFGLGGILLDLEGRDGRARLTDLGKRVLAKKPRDVYSRCKRMVKIHDVGTEPDYMFVVMDMLEVEPIGKADPATLGGDVMDIVSWGVDCCVALCNMHVEEGRLHLNVRPEAFIRHEVKQTARLPKYCFFHYPKKYHRPDGSPSLSTEFIMVDHLDTSVDIADRGPKGLCTVGSWPFIPPETIIQLLKTLRTHYDIYVEQGRPVNEVLTIRLARTQMDDVWALGITLYQFLTGGRNPFGQPRNLVDMVNSILLTKFDFSPIDPRFRGLISDMLEKDPKKRFQSLLEGCPEKLKSRRVLAEAILFKLEQIGLQHHA